MVPVLRFLAGMPMHLAVSVSLLIMCLTSTAGASIHFFLGHVVLGYAVYMACGVILGAQIGARIQIRTKPKILQLIFGVALLLIGIRMGLSPFI